MAAYTETIRQWALDLRRSGVLSDPDGTGEVGLDAHEAGRRLAVRFTLKVAEGKITDIRFQVFGCGFTIAACAATAELATDCSLTAIHTIDAARVDAILAGLPEERSYCAELAVEALHAAVKSAHHDRRPVAASVASEPEHGPRVTAAHPVYAALVASPKPTAVTAEDRHLFACLLAVAGDESYESATALGLTAVDLGTLRATFFPSAESIVHRSGQLSSQPPPETNDDILAILLSHVPSDAPPSSILLARILAARAAQPGHLWVAMGLFERPQLTAAIRRHLPTLAEANNKKMRWKRYLYKQVCDLNSGTMCKAPNCGECSDFARCFVAE